MYGPCDNAPLALILFQLLRDTVGSVASKLPFTSSPYVVRNFRHALALDEHRAKFKASLWTRPYEDNKNVSDNEKAAGRTTGSGPANEGKVRQDIVGAVFLFREYLTDDRFHFRNPSKMLKKYLKIRVSELVSKKSGLQDVIAVCT